MHLNLILLTWRIWWAPNNAGKGQMGFNSAFKGLTSSTTISVFSRGTPLHMEWWVHSARSNIELNSPNIYRSEKYLEWQLYIDVKRVFYTKQTCCVSRMAFSTTGKATRTVMLSANGNNRPLAPEFFRCASIWTPVTAILCPNLHGDIAL